MMKNSLNGAWKLSVLNTGETYNATVPGSVYCDLLNAQAMEDPYFSDNELKAFPIMNNDFLYEREFEITQQYLLCDEVMLCCDGIDTIAQIKVNNVLIGNTNNMHRSWKFSLKEHLHVGTNQIAIKIFSPLNEIKRENKKQPLLGSLDGIQGFSHIRKAHYMFGWDWGIRLPDAGIWRDIYLCAIDTAEIADVAVTQRHQCDEVTLTIDANIQKYQDADVHCLYSVVSPQGQVLITDSTENDIRITNPELWWPNGYGKQPLYQIQVCLYNENGNKLDEYHCRVGLRTLTMAIKKDAYGESFCHEINGVEIFAMGADYIPEDNILSASNPNRTRKLLEQCKLSNFNCVRVWGGGFYPSDDFYDCCDELGLLVWQDFMFACAAYKITEDFIDNIAQEVKDNAIRLRNHACLALWCGNNEMEWFTTQKRYNNTDELKEGYLILFEEVIPAALRSCDKQTFYWPSSPSSGGKLKDPNSDSFGDSHYWDVWHSNLPFSDYRNHVFRYVSEFGFQSFPCLQTIKSFTKPEDRNIFSYVMEKHQRNGSANGNIMNYLARTFLYPNQFETLLYASQLLQAEAIQYGVQHWRRNRGVCMGTLYWQLNDCWPVASWSSIDYFGRWKALQYYAKRFYAPLAISCREEGLLTQLEHINVQPQVIEAIKYSAMLHVANETMHDFHGKICWQIRKKNAEIVVQGSKDVSIASLSAQEEVDVPCEEIKNHLNDYYLSYQLVNDQNQCCSEGTTLLTLPKYFHFEEPHFEMQVEGKSITIKADTYAKSVEIYSDCNDFILSDNFFDLNADSKTVSILNGNAENLKVRSVWDIR